MQALAGKRHHAPGCDAGVLVQDVAHAVARQRLAPSIAEEWLGACGRAPGLAEQGLQSLYGLGPQRAPARLAALAVQPGLPRALQMQVAGPQVQDFLDAGAGVVQREQQRVVPATVRGGLQGTQQGLQLVRVQVLHQALVGAFEGDRQDALA